MTLTDLLPSMRHSLPAPMTADRWPEHTRATPTDVVMAGVSLLRYAELCSTPCVHGGAAVVPGTGGRASRTQECSIVVTSVVVITGCDGDLIAVLDADLSSMPVAWAEARLIGRVSTARNLRITALTPSGRPQGCVALPSDLAEGDLIAVPCAGLLVLGDLRADGRRR